MPQRVRPWANAGHAMGGPGRPWNGDLVRYDEATDVFAILDSVRFIKTCYRPDPLFHGEASNLEYYLEEEAKA